MMTNYFAATYFDSNYFSTVVVPVPIPREDIRTAFTSILSAAGLGVPVYDRMPFEGVDSRSVVVTIVAGSNKSPGIGLRDSTGQGLEDYFRVRIDCYYDDATGVGVLADSVEQALMVAIDTLSSTYDIHGLRNIADVDTLGVGAVPLTRVRRVLLDFSFFTHRKLA